MLVSNGDFKFSCKGGIDLCTGNMKGTTMTDTAATRLDQWKAEGFVPENCPVRSILGHVAAKWTSLILLELSVEPRRFNALGRALPDISKRMLTQSLRDLERDGMVERRVFDTKPPSVQYSLTDMGQSVLKPLTHMVDWAMDHQDEISQNRNSFDAQANKK